jgi:acetamidase/formamidase
MPTIHTLEPERRTLHGHFSRELPPVVTIDAGDTVTFRTLDSNWGLESYRPGQGIQRREFEGRISPDDDGHTLVGPVAIRGAKAGMTLEVQIGAVVPGVYGACMAGGWRSAWNDRLGISSEGVIHVYTLDTATMTGRNQHGHTVMLRPFMGIMGMPPDAPGHHSTTPPRACGGNIDCKELVAGSTLYLPIAVDGALFSTGDGHAAQGDGESGSTGIECPMERVELTFHLHNDMPLTTPIARTPAGWLTLGFHEDLDEATMFALEAMFALISRQYGVSRLDAIALASVAVDLRITQMVNQARGVHALLPFEAIR